MANAARLDVGGLIRFVNEPLSTQYDTPQALQVDEAAKVKSRLADKAATAEAQQEVSSRL